MVLPGIAPTTGCSHLQPATRPVVELASHFPPIMWLLRDSVLDVVDDGTLVAASASQVGDSTTIIRLNLPAYYYLPTYYLPSLLPTTFPITYLRATT